jgi:hypothetical protein
MSAATIAQPQARECHACGRSFISGDGAFCRTGCRDAYDNGFTAQPTRITYSLPPGRHGFMVACPACRKTFDSTGLRCCSPACERELKRKAELAAELDASPVDREPLYQPRPCEHCAAALPRYTLRNGKRTATPLSKRFCGPKCARQASQARNHGIAESTVQKPLGDKGFQQAISDRGVPA